MERTIATRTWVAITCIALLLAGCGGGGGGKKDGSKTPTAPAPTPTVTVAISSPAISQSLSYGDDFTTVVSGTWSGSNLGSNAVYLQVTDTGGVFAMPTVQTAPAGNTFNYTLNLLTRTGAGNRTGTLTVRACKDVVCAQPYSGASANVSYQLQITAVAEWETVQGNAAHTGYVPVRLDPTKFSKAWEWEVPMAADATSSFVGNAVTSEGAVHVMGSARNSNGFIYDVRMYAVDEASGIQKWNYAINAASPSTPSASRGIAYVTSSYSNTLLTGINASSGSTAFSYTTFDQAQRALHPATVYDGIAYVSGGTSGRQLHAVNANGQAVWMRDNSGAVGGLTPAVDRDSVYTRTYKAVSIRNRLTGDVSASIDDPSSDGTCGSSVDIPMLGSRGNVITFSCDYRITPWPFRISSFNIANRSLEWTSEAGYIPSYPATANGVIYAKREGSVPMVDALDEATGKLLWSWSPPESEGQTLIIGNLLVTRNLLFVGTGNSNVGQRNTWAIDLNTRQVIWRYQNAGWLALSANRTLYLATTLQDTSRGKVIAFKLR